MKNLTIDHKNGNFTTYQLIEDGGNLPIAYNEKTSQKVIDALEHCRKNNIRIKLYYGDIETGMDWHEENGVIGYIRLSRGFDARFPILVYNARSMGGGVIIDHCIIRITTSSGKKELYKAANYQQPIVEIVESSQPGYLYSLNIDGTLYSNHKTLKSAERLKNHIS